ncbi:hypothetical protein CYANOKiyG1_70620 [Okeania sp. KiyG1]|nr:hypothetical protein CYANOKiyG1_70620 [Okeania sp. KiyG1]
MWGPTPNPSLEGNVGTVGTHPNLPGGECGDCEEMEANFNLLGLPADATPRRR